MSQWSLFVTLRPSKNSTIWSKRRNISAES